MSYRSVFRADLFQGKTVVVTGGGSGIGRCTAHELAALGARVVIVGRKEEKLIHVCEEIFQDGGHCTYQSCDIRDESQVVATVKNIVEECGQIDALVNNAGGQFPAMLTDISQKGWETVVRTNLTGGFLMAREVYKQSMRDKGGAIVNILADMWRGMPLMGHSGAARAGMENFTKTAAYEWAASGVRVNAVAPGWIISSGLDTYPDEMLPFLRSLRSAVPLKRLGREAEVSAAICFLLSPAAAFINGTTLQIDGGAPLSNEQVLPIPEHDNSRPFEGFHREILPAIAKVLLKE